MQTRLPRTRLTVASLLVLFLACGLGLSALTNLERQLGLIGNASYLRPFSAPQALTGIDDNLSGITWNSQAGTFFAVTNSPEAIYELSTSGNMLRRIELRGFQDTEDIAHLGRDRFALLEERRGIIRIVRITEQTTTLQVADWPAQDLGERYEDNDGFESLHFDPSTGTLLTMREVPPHDLLSMQVGEWGQHWAIQRTLLDLDVNDVAALARDKAGDLWILSQASSCLVRLRHGQRHGQRFNLREGGRRFQPEGLAFGPEGRLFVVGEPNILAVYLPPDR